MQKNSKGKITKAKAIRRALKSMGNDAKATEVQKHIKQRYGVDVTTKTIYMYKSQSRAGGKSAVISKKMGRPAKSAPAPRPAASSGGISIADINAVKALTDRIGAKSVKELADVMR